METEMIDRLYLELSQVTKAITPKEEMYRREIQRLQTKLAILREAADEILSNEEHATSGGMRSYAPGSQTALLWDALKAAAKDAV